MKKEQQKEQKKKKKKANASAKTESIQNGIAHVSPEGKTEQPKEVTEVPKKKKHISSKKPSFTAKGIVSMFLFLYAQEKLSNSFLFMDLFSHFPTYTLYHRYCKY